MPDLLYEKRDGIATITLNRPERRNAFSPETIIRLAEAWIDYRDDPELHVAILTGAGDKAFAAGADIAQLKERTHTDALAAINSTIFKRIEDFPWPSIAAIKGYALGGGCELAIACDLRVAGASAKMGQPEVSLGIIPAAGGTYRLPRLIGLGKARELVYTGRIIDADECLRMGLVNDVVADVDVMTRARELAAEIAGRGRTAVRLAKAAMNALARPGEAAAMSFESIAQAVLFDSDDKHERMARFLDRKKKS